MEDTRKQMEEEIREELEKIRTEVNGIMALVPKEPAEYTDVHGLVYKESPGKYNDRMTRAMASDMFWFCLMFQSKHPEFAGRAGDMAVKTTDLNNRLMRKHDDCAGDRPMEKWDGKEILELITDIKDAVDAIYPYKEAGCRLAEDFLKRCGTWAERVMYMDTWALGLEELEDIGRTLSESQTEMFDSRGSRILGLDENSREFIKALCAVRRSITKLLVCVPVYGEHHGYLMDKLKLFRMLSRAVMEE